LRTSSAADPASAHRSAGQPSRNHRAAAKKTTGLPQGTDTCYNLRGCRSEYRHTTCWNKQQQKFEVLFCIVLSVLESVEVRFFQLAKLYSRSYWMKVIYGPSSFTPGTHWIGSLMGLRTCLDDTEKRKSHLYCYSGSAARNPPLYLLGYPSSY
jgi:hypothetical protein